jgi:hypothetical protein
MGWKVRPHRRALAAVLGLAALGAAGCYLPHFGVWLFAPRHPTKTVKAEYVLAAERLVVVPYAGTETLFNYSMAPLEVSAEIVNRIVANLHGRVKTLINPVTVVQWQESNVEWPNMSLADIGKAFQADTVLYVELGRYTMLEDGSANLYRGHIQARIQVAKTEAERNPVYEASVEVLFPPDNPVGVTGTSEAIVIRATNAAFAAEVVGKFHDRQVSAEGGKP